MDFVLLQLSKFVSLASKISKQPPQTPYSMFNKYNFPGTMKLGDYIL